MNAADFLRMADLLPEPMLLVRSDGLVRAANRKAASLLAIPREPESLQFDRLLAEPGDRSADFLQSAARRGNPGPGRLTLRTAAQGLYSASLHAARLGTEENGAPLVMIRIEPASSLTRSFLNLNRAKSEFLANMSHELRTPLNAIIGYAEMLQDELDANGDSMKAADAGRIRVSGRHLLSLIGDILDLARIEEGRLVFHCEEFEVRTAAAEAMILVSPLLEKNGNRSCIDCGSEIGTVWSDPTRVRQILFNLLSNSAKFTHNGLVRLTGLRDGDRVVLRVEDTGIGIDSDHQSRIFEKFYQVDSTPTGRYDGSGLGLAITRMLCERLGGRIEIQSEPGRGSTFLVDLPIDSRPYILPLPTGS